MKKTIYAVTIETPYGSDTHLFDNSAKADDAYEKLFLEAMNAYGYDEKTSKDILEGELESQDVFAKVESFDLDLEFESRILEIEWELDLEEDENYDDKDRGYKLPTLIETALDNDNLANELSDKYGWLINGFKEVK